MAHPAGSVVAIVATKTTSKKRAPAKKSGAKRPAKGRSASRQAVGSVLSGHQADLWGVGAILARSFGRIFYRNALNFGIPAIVFPQATEVRAGDRLAVDPVTGEIENQTQNSRYSVTGLPEHLMSMIDAGGLMPYLKQRIEKR